METTLKYCGILMLRNGMLRNDVLLTAAVKILPLHFKDFRIPTKYIREDSWILVEFRLRYILNESQTCHHLSQHSVYS
jgi:hypothetical protein